MGPRGEEGTVAGRETRAARRKASPNAGKVMLYQGVELRRQIRKKNVVALPVLDWTVTSRRRYGGADSEPGGRHDTKQYTKEKKEQ